ncbi:tetratricopeptide repeat protein [Hydrogenophaga sp.]|uniref:tetratricopeptide repeat protein n=1 Tax=Hydrogenophaga sp. TaxID=1904254 RepID=UPI002718A5CA|nr:tetratricopeptide repeat protein [Hydrogenophaga sp.]MDO8906509.1 tetratricopeptide repeat protein [Hydrogenophaga sp.]
MGVALLGGCQTTPTPRASEPAAVPTPAAVETQAPSASVLAIAGELTPEGKAQRDRGVALFEAREDALALQVWLPLAEAGHPETQYNLGVLMTRGGTVRRDLAAARRWQEQASAGGYAAANCALGDLLWADRSDPVHRQRALAAYLRGAALGQVPCMHNTAAFLLNGYAGSPDVIAGLHWLERAAEAGSATSQAQLGSAHLHGTYIPPEYERALRWLTLAAEQGHVDATHDLAYMWEHGLGTAPDLTRAAALYQQAAAAGQSLSANNLGLMYRNAQGVPQDHTRAVTFFEQAVGLRNTDAMVNLGDMHYLGLGVPADPARAAALYQQAASAGQLWGDCRMAALLRHGEGVPADAQRANALQRRVLSRMPSADCVTPLSRLLR